MKRWKVVTTMLAAALILGGGLGGWSATSADTRAENIADSDQAVEVAADGTFEITLDSNPTTGYSWQAEYDETYLELVDRTFEPSSDAIGAGGSETLVFKALRNGDTTVTLEYKRPWEETSITTESFDVKISD